MLGEQEYVFNPPKRASKSSLEKTPREGGAMKAVVVYESLWGNTAAIARAIAEGMGASCRVLSTAEACEAEMDGVDFVVAGAPILGFTLPTDSMRKQEATDRKAPKPADLSHPSMRNWLKTLPQGTGRGASFETRIWWSPGSSAKQILSGLEKAGYRPAGREKFLVTGAYGPLKDGELDRARAWARGSPRATRARRIEHITECTTHPTQSANEKGRSWARTSSSR